MKRSDEPGFPTVGEVVQFLYKAAGVLPDKRDLTPAIDEKQRKAIQKALERLAKEEGNLQDQINEAIRQLASLVAGYVPHAGFGLAIGEVAMDMVDVYRYAIQDQGTYSSRRETLCWMLEEHWAPAAAFSVAKQITKFGLREYTGFFPGDGAWYLPEMGTTRPTWPLAKVMHWIYDGMGVSQTQFHYPGRKADETEDGRERDLENAQHWARGRHWPSAAGLDWCFRRGYALHDKDERFTPVQREASCITLFLARCISYAASALEAEFGKDCLERVCMKFEGTLAITLAESARVEQWIGDIAQRYSVTPLDPGLRCDVVTQWCRELQQRTRAANAEIEQLYHRDLLGAEQVNRLVAKYGAFPVIPAVEQLQSSERRIVPPEFVAAIGEGMQLSNDRTLDAKAVDAYEASLLDTNMHAVLPWMVPWLRFQLAYRRRDDDDACTWIQRAYHAARYLAGSRQEIIVNHYVEMAAKTNNFRMFKKGVHWARYIGVEIRWLRDKALERETLEDAMEILRHARYPV